MTHCILHYRQQSLPYQRIFRTSSYRFMTLAPEPLFSAALTALTEFFSRTLFFTEAGSFINCRKRGFMTSGVMHRLSSGAQRSKHAVTESILSHFGDTECSGCLGEQKIAGLKKARTLLAPHAIITSMHLLYLSLSPQTALPSAAVKAYPATSSFSQSFTKIPLSLPAHAL